MRRLPSRNERSDRHGQIIDPFGHRWGLAQLREELSPDEIQKRANEFFVGFAT